jgi:hypothetical protein
MIYLKKGCKSDTPSNTSYTLENTEEPIDNEQSRESRNIEYTRRRKTKQKHNTACVGHHTNKQKHNTACVGHHTNKHTTQHVLDTTQTNTNNVMNPHGSKQHCVYAEIVTDTTY